MKHVEGIKRISGWIKMVIERVLVMAKVNQVHGGRQEGG